MDNIEKIKELVQNNNGILLAKEAQKNNIHRQYIRQLEETGYLKKVSKGVYAEKDKEINEFFILGQKYKKGIFSHNTALYFLNLTNRAPMEIDITTPRDKRVRGNYNIHRVSNKIYNIGIIEVIDPYGNPIKIYNAERCICDILRNEILDIEQRNRVLDYYFKSKNKDVDRLLEYAKKFKIYDKVNTIMGVMLRW